MSPRSTMRPIALIGMMGAGKSVVGAALAEKLRCPFTDLDGVIATRVGMHVSEFIRQQGEPAFRDLEAACIREMLASGTFSVIATGGGAVLREESAELLARDCHAVWLHAPVSVLSERLADSTDRPLLDGGDLPSRVAQLDAERSDIYRTLAHVIVNTEGMDPSEIADAILTELHLGAESEAEPSVVSVRGIGAEYDIRIAPGALAAVPAAVRGVRRVVLVTQRNMLDPWASRLESAFAQSGIIHDTITIGDGEDAKRLVTVETLCRQFAERGLLRDDAVVALGGGIVGDVAGFAAAVYHRGIAVHQVPTSLLAMVDSSVGGKTGVNLPEGKNLVGAFHQPRSVTIDPEVLSTLPEREYIAGLGEIAKYALMGPKFDAAYGLSALLRSGSSSLRARDPGLLARVIHRCVQLKADVVMDDPLERSGARAALNYGHTLGHALEIETAHELLHGEAVAIGLIFAAELAQVLGLLSLEAADHHYEVVSSLGLPTSAPVGCDADRIVGLMRRDKKAVGSLTFMLRSGDGVQRVEDPPLDAVMSALERVGISPQSSTSTLR